MLNGRVYGARKTHHPSTNVFQNIPDKEPEFVEWGYGGMGSVHSGGMWAKVQTRAPEADDNDASGMGWVKKRREERDRKKREELAASEAASKTDAVSAPNPVSASVPVQGAVLNSVIVSVDHDVSTVTPVQPDTEDHEDDSSSEDEEVEAEDESSSTEQEDDDADQVRYRPLLTR